MYRKNGWSTFGLIISIVFILGLAVCTGYGIYREVKDPIIFKPATVVEQTEVEQESITDIEEVYTDAIIRM